MVFQNSRPIYTESLALKILVVYAIFFYTPDGVISSQQKFARELLATIGLDLHKPTITPLILNLKLSVDT